MMFIEERVEILELQNKELRDIVDDLINKQNEEFVTAKELSEIMKCSINHIYSKIRSGEIFATDKLGSIPRIPMSQFYKNNPKEKKMKKTRQVKEQKPKTMEELIFG